ncbi:MAG: hydrogenase-4 component A [Sulfurimonas sp.]|jgi:hydrogenase-4 component A
MNVPKRGNNFVLANPAVCIGCATCMAGCYESSLQRGKLAVPRLIVTRSNSGTMPNQCRQCDDAPCANVCPTGALRFGSDSIEVYEESCIGCKMCVIACPFGAIRLESEITSLSYADSEADSLKEVKTKAVKCDLCFGREDGPACVEVCPTGALSFVTSQYIASSVVNKKAEDAVEAFIKSSLNNR